MTNEHQAISSRGIVLPNPLIAASLLLNRESAFEIMVFSIGENT